MRTRIYVNGKPDWTENEPGGYARRAGWGGSALGHFTGTVVAARKPKGTADAEAAAKHRRSA